MMTKMMITKMMINTKSKKFIVIVSIFSGILLLAAGLISGIFINGNIRKQAYYPGLEITGDVSENIIIKSEDFLTEDAGLTRHKIDFNGSKVFAFKLQEILGLSKPVSPDSKVYLAGSDGKAAEVLYSDTKDCYIVFSAEKGWEAKNPLHPPSTNIKDLSKIIVAADSAGPGELAFGFSLITMDRNLIHVTPGNLALDSNTVFDLAGTSSKELTGSAYVVREIFTIDGLLLKYDVSDRCEDLLIISEEGQFIFTNDPGYFEISGNEIDYMPGDGSETVKKIKGVVMEPVAASIMDAYYDTLTYIKKDRKVLLIITDGLGYDQFSEAMKNGYAPFLAGLKDSGKAAIRQALSVYQPVTNAGLAAILTGRTPYESGVHSRKQRELLVPSVFSEVSKLGKKSLYIEADIQILKTEVEPILNTDTNADGTIDDEIYNRAMSSLKTGNDFIVVHFHSIDDAGHSWGPYSEKTFERIRVIDGYLEDMLRNWNGVTIVTSDHGMHEENDEGSHGQFRQEDLVVPYIIIES